MDPMEMLLDDGCYLFGITLVDVEFGYYMLSVSSGTDCGDVDKFLDPIWQSQVNYVVWMFHSPCGLSRYCSDFLIVKMTFWWDTQCYSRYPFLIHDDLTRLRALTQDRCLWDSSQ